MVKASPCSVHSCTTRAKVRSLCNAHYQRYLKYGDPTYYPPKKPLQHGTNTGYTYHRCRCAPCREAHAEANRREQRSRFGYQPLVDASTAKTNLSCLLSFGVRASRISRAMGKAHRGKPRIRTLQVRAATAEAIGNLHWDLWRTHGPFRRHCGCAVPDEVRAWLEEYMAS